MQIRTYDARDVLELSNSQHQELTLDNLVEIRKQSALEKAEDRTVTV
jgi:hypothetical protein